ncbi:hypothetical protein RND81_04G038100 [Saponaria officinalis]
MRFRMLFETEESSVRRYMGTITGICDLDAVRWPNSHWRSVKVGWDESTAGERQPRVSLWEIEPLTTFPMYPSLFPLRFKRPWHAGTSSLPDTMDDPANSLLWLRGQGGEQGLNSLNFQSMGMFPWMQARADGLLPVNSQSQPFQALLSSNLRGGDIVSPQLMQFQQPMHYFQQATNQTPMLQQQQQQMMHSSISQPIFQGQSQVSKDNVPQHMVHQGYLKQQEGLQNHPLCGPESFSLQSNEMQNRQPSNISSSLGKPEMFSSGHSHPPVVTNMLDSMRSEGIGNLSDLSNIDHLMMNESTSQHPLVSSNSYTPINAFGDVASLPPYPGKDGSLENHNVFGANLDSSGLVLPMTMPTTYRTSATNADICSIPSDASGFHTSLYGCNSSSPELHSEGQDDLSTTARTFVKVYRTGSVGRSLDISRFSSYHELREELGQMFGIEGKLDDPLRSGWQLVFVDRENDVLLLGDDPWEAFVNNVWYIKILSPEDIQKMGNQGSESYSR